MKTSGILDSAELIVPPGQTQEKVSFSYKIPALPQSSYTCVFLVLWIFLSLHSMLCLRTHSWHFHSCITDVVKLNEVSVSVLTKEVTQRRETCTWANLIRRWNPYILPQTICRGGFCSRFVLIITRDDDDDKPLYRALKKHSKQFHLNCLVTSTTS